MRFEVDLGPDFGLVPARSTFRMLHRRPAQETPEIGTFCAAGFGGYYAKVCQRWASKPRLLGIVLAKIAKTNPASKESRDSRSEPNTGTTCHKGKPYPEAVCVRVPDDLCSTFVYEGNPNSA